MPESYHIPEKKQPRKIRKFPEANPGYKFCIACGLEKLFEAFHRMKSSSDGYRPVCKQCRKEGKSSPIAQPSSPDKRICTACECEKDLDQFDKSANHTGGYQTSWKECRSKHNRKFRQKNIEKFRAYDQMRAKDPTRNEANKERRQKVYAIDGRYDELNKKNKQRWYQNNKMKAKEQCLRRIAAKKGATIGKVNLSHILARDGYWCHICNAPIDSSIKKGAGSLAFDHVIPIQPRPGEPQGTHSEENLHPAHRACNIRKSNIPLDQLTPFHRRGI